MANFISRVYSTKYGYNYLFTNIIDMLKNKTKNDIINSGLQKGVLMVIRKS